MDWLSRAGRRVWIASAFFAVLAAGAGADTVHLAVASNFAEAMKVIAAAYERESGHRVVLSFGSTGKHYAQIRNGAPFDAFFAADEERPKLLEAEKKTVAASRFTYALGRIALWSPKPGFVDDAGAVLAGDGYRHLAITNPKLAPYGAAAKEVLEKKGLWEWVRPRLAQGENVSQTFQFVASGNAELGFLAYAQIKYAREKYGGSYWLAPSSLHAPITQQAVLLEDTPGARGFMAFVKSDKIKKVIAGFGYGLPKAEVTKGVAERVDGE